MKERYRKCNWCGQVIRVSDKKEKELKLHLEKYHNDYQHKNKK